jgi:hypothetical protein
MPKLPAIAAVPDGEQASDVDETADADQRARRSRIAEVWGIAMAHMQLGDVPIEALDLGDPLPETPETPTPAPGTAPERGAASGDDDRAHPANEAEIDESVDESFPASDPPSWSKSHA